MRGAGRALDEAAVEQLCQRTIDTGRSLGTLAWYLNDLGKKDTELKRALEEKVGASRYLCMVRANSTVFELFAIVEGGSVEFARALAGRWTRRRSSSSASGPSTLEDPLACWAGT